MSYYADLIRGAKNLADLCDALNECILDDIDYESCGIDTSSLPTFGGSEPRDTGGVYSWDEHSLLVPANRGWRLIPRPDFFQVCSSYGPVNDGDYYDYQSAIVAATELALMWARESGECCVSIERFDDACERGIDQIAMRYSMWSTESVATITAHADGSVIVDD